MNTPILGLLKRVFTIRSFAGGVTLEAFLRFVDAWAILGLLASLAFAMLWCWSEGITPVTITTALFAILGLALGDAGYLSDVVAFGRPVSPLILFLLLRGVAAREWLSILAPMGMSLGCAVFYLSPALRIFRTLISFAH